MTMFMMIVVSVKFAHLRKHTLMVKLHVHVDAGEEDAVRRVGMDPAQEDYVLPLVHLPQDLGAVHDTAVRVSSLSRY